MSEETKNKKRKLKSLWPLFVAIGVVGMTLGIVLPIALAPRQAEVQRTFTDEELREGIIRAVRLQYKEYVDSPEDIFIRDDYGVFNGLYVARFDGLSAMTAFFKETINGLALVYSDSIRAMAYDGYSLYTIKAAYRDLKFDMADLRRIRDRQNELHPGIQDYVNGSFELDRSTPLVLEEKETWAGGFPDGFSGTELDVTIDWNFNAHVFKASDFKYDGVDSIRCLTEEYFSRYGNDYPEGVNHRYRLQLKEGGKDAATKAINSIKDLDYVKRACPVLG